MREDKEEEKKDKSLYIRNKDDKVSASKYIKSRSSEEVPEANIQRRTDSKIIKSDKPELSEPPSVLKAAKPHRRERFIREKVSGSAASSYFLDSVAESKHFLNEHRRFTSIYISFIALVLTASICLLIVFGSYNSKHQKHLDRRTQILNDLQGQLDELNLKYISDVLLNPSIYHALDSQRRFEQYLFTYTISIEHGGQKYELSTFKDNYQPRFDVWGSTDARIVITENYSLLAKKYLSADTLKLFSLFVSPVKSSGKDWVMRDYRTFFNLDGLDGYEVKEDGSESYFLSVDSSMTDSGNSYVFTLNNFISVEQSVIPRIYFRLSNDLQNNILLSDSPASSRTLTTSGDVNIAPYDFKLKLASGSNDEKSLLMSAINELGSDISENLLYDFGRNNSIFTVRGIKSLAQAIIGESGIMKTITALDRFYIDLALNGTLSNLGEVGINGFKAALNKLLNLKGYGNEHILDLLSKTQSELFTECKIAAESALHSINNEYTVLEIIDKFPVVSFAFSSSDVTRINNLYKKYKEKILTDSEKGSFTSLLAHILLYSMELDLAKAQAIELIKTATGIDYDLSTNTELKALSESFNGSELNTAQKQTLSEVLEIFSDKNVSEISLCFLKVNSLIKGFDFNNKLTLSGVIIVQRLGG